MEKIPEFKLPKPQIPEQPVVITDIDIGFVPLTVLLFKIMLAAIPASLCAGAVYFFILAILGGLMK